MEDDEAAVYRSNVVHWAVHAGEEIGQGFSDGDDNSEQLLGGLEQGPILLRAHVNVDEFGAGGQLHDHRGSDDWRDTKLHERALVGGQNDTKPVQRVSTLLTDRAVERDLTADEVEEEHDGGPKHLLPEGQVLADGGIHVGQQVPHGGHKRDQTHRHPF